MINRIDPDRIPSEKNSFKLQTVKFPNLKLSHPIFSTARTEINRMFLKCN